MAIDELDCDDLDALGLWSTTRCCGGCHAGVDCSSDDGDDEGDDELTFEFVDPKSGRSLRLSLCCASADTLVFDDATLARIGAMSTAKAS